MSEKSNTFDMAIQAIVSSIPRGQVLSYGEVARAAGYPRHARLVSKAMSRCTIPLPWYRVVRSDRTLAFKPGSDIYQTQKHHLEEEGVTFENGKVVPVVSDENIDLDILLWGPE
jgi:methylated-DNA-protein-cysteine methyltransferase-like protein